MKLRFRVKHRGVDANRAGVLTTTIICVAQPHESQDDANYRAWGGRLPHGELRLDYLTPEAAELFAPGMEVTVALRLRGPTNDNSNASRAEEQQHQHEHDSRT